MPKGASPCPSMIAPGSPMNRSPLLAKMPLVVTYTPARRQKVVPEGEASTSAWMFSPAARPTPVQSEEPGSGDGEGEGDGSGAGGVPAPEAFWLVNPRMSEPMFPAPSV